jgi:hypothetical protein
MKTTTKKTTPSARAYWATLHRCTAVEKQKIFHWDKQKLINKDTLSLISQLSDAVKV